MGFPKTGYKLLSLMFLFVLVAPIFSVDSGERVLEGKEGKLRVNSSYQLIPLTNEIGSGRVRLDIEGEAAVEFRHALLDSVGSGDDILNEDELRWYFGEGGLLSSYIQRGEELEKFRSNLLFSKYGFKPKRDIAQNEELMHQGLKIDSVRLPNRDISEDTNGLLNTSYDERSPIQIDLQLRFEGEKRLERRYIKPSESGLISSLWDSLIIPVEVSYTQNLTEEEKGILEGGMVLDDKNLLVGGDRVQGVVVKNGKRMDKKNYSFERDGKVTVHDNLSVGDSIGFYYAYGVEWSGSTEVTHWNFVLGTDSFRPRSREGESLFILRTPGGNLLRYEYELESEQEDDPGLVWDGFNVLDNPQILFFMVALLAYTSLKTLSYNYEKYRAELPDDGEKKRWLHLGSKISCLVLFVLYFIPVIGPFFISGFRLILISTAVSMTIIGLSKAAYDKRISAVVKGLFESEEKERLNKRLLKRSKRKRELKKLKCRYCEEEFGVPIKRSPLTVLCPNCGRRIRRLTLGRNHLLVAKEKKRWGIYSLFIQFLSEGLPGLVLSSHEPGEIEKTFRVNRDLVVKVVERPEEEEDDENKEKEKEKKEENEKKNEKEKGKKREEGKNEIALSELNSIGVGLLERFAEDHEKGVILIEGLGELYDDLEGFEDFLDESLKTLEGKDATLLIQLDRENVSEDGLKRLKDKVDRWETL